MKRTSLSPSPSANFVGIGGRLKRNRIGDIPANILALSGFLVGTAHYLYLDPYIRVNNMNIAAILALGVPQAGKRKLGCLRMWYCIRRWVLSV